MPNARYAEIDSPQAIADAFVDLTRNVHEVTLRFDGSMIHYPVSVMAVDRILGHCLLDITGIGDVSRLLTVQQPFVLHARQASAALQTSSMSTFEVVKRSARLGLRCALPSHLILLKRRGYFRAALNDGMAVEVVLSGARGCEWRATLRDLSIGGCLLSLPSGEEAGLEIGSGRYQARACFPNGETFEASSHLSHSYVDEDAGLTYIGVTFDIGLEKEAREAWFYVREVEREVARQTSVRPELRPLAASRLFEGDSDSLAQ
ncbi:metal dependent phosphohydrolase [Salinisphaera dokdonensis CL-ES53]|uniref:Metal dependent phosphohydrolase n=1 Tax=Salinisphaera dokdonensis CL-ES53 TaxID=1304272 RepID=A0ABV2B2L6_9GAMM